MLAILCTRVPLASASSDRAALARAHRMRKRWLLPLPLLCTLTGCPDRTISEVNPEQAGVESKDIPVKISRDLDLLFLIDKSPTMTDEQAGLTANFPRFIQVLRQIDGGLPNLHLGVISQDIGAGGLTVGGNCSGAGDNGNLLATPRIAGCTPPNGNFISDIESMGGARIKNYTGSLEDTFSCIATLGPNGCGFEQHLGSLKKALVDNPANASFLRPDAFLAIVIISDEDDCTASNPRIYDSNAVDVGVLSDFRCFEWGWECDEGTMSRTGGTYSNCRPRTSSPYLFHPDVFIQDIKNLKSDEKKIIVATMMGPRPQDLQPPERTRVTTRTVGGVTVPFVEPSCVNGDQNAFPMPRLLHFQQGFTNNTFYSLCNNDLSAGLTDVAKLIRRAIGNPCFETDLDQTDTAPDNPGLQPQCTVSDVANPDSANPVETILPPCKMADASTPAGDTKQPCWYVASDPVQCEAYPTKLKIATYPPDREAPADSRLLVQCVTKK
jgi:hypothetical protein